MSGKMSSKMGAGCSTTCTPDAARVCKASSPTWRMKGSDEMRTCAVPVRWNISTRAAELFLVETRKSVHPALMTPSAVQKYVIVSVDLPVSTATHSDMEHKLITCVREQGHHRLV